MPVVISERLCEWTSKNKTIQSFKETLYTRQSRYVEGRLLYNSRLPIYLHPISPVRGIFKKFSASKCKSSSVWLNISEIIEPLSISNLSTLHDFPQQVLILTKRHTTQCKNQDIIQDVTDLDVEIWSRACI